MRLTSLPFIFSVEREVPLMEPEPLPVPEPMIGEAVYCDVCEMWLNGHQQWEDHERGKKHQKNLWRGEQSLVSLSNEAIVVKSEFEQDHELMVGNLNTLGGETFQCHYGQFATYGDLVSLLRYYKCKIVFPKSTTEPFHPDALLSALFQDTVCATIIKLEARDT